MQLRIDIFFLGGNHSPHNIQQSVPESDLTFSCTEKKRFLHWNLKEILAALRCATQRPNAKLCEGQ